MIQRIYDDSDIFEKGIRLVRSIISPPKHQESEFRDGVVAALLLKARRATFKDPYTSKDFSEEMMPLYKVAYFGKDESGDLEPIAADVAETMARADIAGVLKLGKLGEDRITTWVGDLRVIVYRIDYGWERRYIAIVLDRGHDVVKSINRTVRRGARRAGFV